jgi:hypothetical protein
VDELMLHSIFLCDTPDQIVIFGFHLGFGIKDTRQERNDTQGRDARMGDFFDDIHHHIGLLCRIFSLFLTMMAFLMH